MNPAKQRPRIPRPPIWPWAPGAWPSPRPDNPQDYPLALAVAFVAIAGTIIQWPHSHIVYPSLALPLFVLTSIAAVAALFPWARLTQVQQVAALAAYALLGAVLLPLAHSTSTAPVFPYIATAAAGAKLTSRRAAISIAVAGAVTAAGATWLVGHLAPAPGQWVWWVALTVGFPVYLGLSRRDRAETVRNAHRAAHEAQRAAKSEAREAALEERGRIAREIHDVLGHSLSGVALQLDMADALHESGREDEAFAAVRRARALAVDSITETRRAVHALREDTLPLPETLRQMAEGNAASFEVTGTPEPLRADTAHTMVRVAQEALTNAAKHAPGAPRVMRLTFSAGRTTLAITNGAATAAPRPDLAGGTGMGLVGMRERVALLGGTLHAGPDGEGWHVELEIPR